MRVGLHVLLFFTQSLYGVIAEEDADPQKGEVTCQGHWWIWNWKAGTPNSRASQVTLEVKSLPANAGDIRDVGLTPGSGRSPLRGHSNPLQYSCLGNPMDRGAWWAAVHGVAQSRPRLKQLSTHACRSNSKPMAIPLPLREDRTQYI